jgi:predicted RNase H-like nuclease (RuvC/YqgF family)
MCNIFDMPREWAEDDKQNEADAFAEALRRMKPEDTISKLTAENAELRNTIRVQEEQIRRLREYIARGSEEYYE